MSTEEPEELNDFLADDAPGSLDEIHLGAESTEELGSATVSITTRAGVHQETVRTEQFDQIQVMDIGGSTVVIGKEAIRAEGVAHLIPTRLIPWKQVLNIDVPMDDGRLEEVDGELIGVNG